MLKNNEWTKADEIFDILGSDLKGSLDVDGLGGKAKFRSLIDDANSNFYNFIEVY